MKVVVHGLQKTPQFNGKQGTLDRYDALTGRWAIALDGESTDNGPDYIRALPTNILPIL